MFSSQERTRIRDALIAQAEKDPDITGAALAGSAARAAEDAWSDIDLVLQLRPDAREAEVVEHWSRWITDRYGVADSLDVFAGSVRYRVFLLPTSLQIDLSFWPHHQFRATEPSFQLIFGIANPATEPTVPDVNTAIGMGWLYALHARSAMARGRLWQAVMMLDDLRNQLIMLLCVRFGLNPWQGREVDKLPAPVREALQASRAPQVTGDDLERARILLTTQFLAEVAQHDRDRAAGLSGALDVLCRSVR
ncbi:MAG TPA: nucleotidyltransferase domain-containing protein [Microlunatus sp.]